MNSESDNPKVRQRGLEIRFLNQSACKQFMLEQATALRPFHTFNRVSRQTLIRLNEIVRATMIGHVRSLPSKGKTI